MEQEMYYIKVKDIAKDTALYIAYINTFSEIHAIREACTQILDLPNKINDSDCGLKFEIEKIKS